MKEELTKEQEIDETTSDMAKYMKELLNLDSVILKANLEKKKVRKQLNMAQDRLRDLG